MSLYVPDYHGYTQHGGKAHRLYQVPPFPRLLTSCTSTPVVAAFPDDSMPEVTWDNPWCLHCYPESGAQHLESLQ